MRWAALVLGVALVVIAFAAATRVSDTREGLLAEVVTLLGGLAGVSLLLYGLAARRRARAGTAVASRAPMPRTPRPRSRNDFLLGAGAIHQGQLLGGNRVALRAGRLGEHHRVGRQRPQSAQELNRMSLAQHGEDGDETFRSDEPAKRRSGLDHRRRVVSAVKNHARS